MHAQPRIAKRPFLARSGDLQARDFPSRLSRFCRARLRRFCAAGVLFADDPRVLQAWWRGWDTAHYIQLRRWHDEGFQPRTIYDIGAHQGLWSEMCQTIYSPGRILLFEPQADVREKAMTRQPRQGGEWQMLPVALGDKQITQRLHVTRNAAASSLLAPVETEGSGMGALEAVAEKQVEVMPLDQLAEERGLAKPDLVKIDVQGFEGRVLAGGRNVLSQAERMVIEVSLHPLYAGQSLMPEVLQTLVSWGFELEDVHETFRQWPGRLWQVDLWLRRKR